MYVYIYTNVCIYIHTYTCIYKYIVRYCIYININYRYIYTIHIHTFVHYCYTRLLLDFRAQIRNNLQCPYKIANRLQIVNQNLVPSCKDCTVIDILFSLIPLMPIPFVLYTSLYFDLQICENKWKCNRKAILLHLHYLKTIFHNLSSKKKINFIQIEKLQSDVTIEHVP